MPTRRRPATVARAPGPNVVISTYKGHYRALRADRIRTPALLMSVLAASAPLTVAGGGVPVGYAVTGLVGMPLAYLGVALVLGLFAVGYVELGRHVHNAGAFYAFVSRGLGGTAGTAAACTALVSYNAMQAGLYGMFGFQVSALLGTHTGLRTAWWVPALACMAVVAVLGVLKIDLNARLLCVLLVAECGLVAVCDIAFLGAPGPEGISLQGWQPEGLAGPGIGAALVFVAAAFTGIESAPVYAEETHRPQVTVGRATFGAIAFTGLFYGISCWAMGVAAGPGAVVEASTEEGPMLLFTLGEARLGSLFASVFHLFFVTSLFAALLSFHNAVARYCFAMGREGLLPRAVGSTSGASGAPALGSVLTTAVALGTVGAFAATGRDPVRHLFSWMCNLGALGIVALMAATSLAVVAFLVRRGIARRLPWVVTAAGASALLLAGMFAVSVAEFDVMVGAGPEHPLRYLLPGLVVAAAAVGACYGRVLLALRPETHARIGLGNEAFQLEKAAASRAGGRRRRRR